MKSLNKKLVSKKNVKKSISNAKNSKKKNSLKINKSKKTKTKKPIKNSVPVEKTMNTTSNQKELSVIADLKNFELAQEKILENARTKALKEIEETKNLIEQERDKLKTSYALNLEKEKEKEKEKTKKEASQFFDEFKKNDLELKKGYEKNKTKAIEAVFKEILK
ncbi:MAG: hypothetical protein JW703_01860 [Candidatus Diapherotrites archaeon]|nr:hypothetical protein [Candidatus Diapherotrites archaeon]